VCLAGASWVRDNVLESHPQADLRVYVIWVSLVPGDSRSEWDAELLTDRRVSHFWDGELVVGTWFGEHVSEMGVDDNTGPVFWDAFLVFDDTATWKTVPAPVTASGSTVIDERETLQEALTALI
jgi:hypothetical protein